MMTTYDARIGGELPAVRAHYDGLLGPIYEWMVGGFDQAMTAARAEVRAVGIGPGLGAAAVDLGAGLGAHAIALAEAGYTVTAIDTCAALLGPLRTRSGRHNLAVIHDDLVNLRRHCPPKLRVALCMGDTLTHLASRGAVAQLFDEVAAALAPGGLFVATFRDYTGANLTGARRVIPVRQDDARTMTCVLEYRADTVVVHDVVHERATRGTAPRVSRYQKLRLDPEWARASLGQRGLSARLEPGPSGMVQVVATRAA